MEMTDCVPFIKVCCRLAEHVPKPTGLRRVIGTLSDVFSQLALLTARDVVVVV